MLCLLFSHFRIFVFAIRKVRSAADNSVARQQRYHCYHRERWLRHAARR